jgi:hypothetical protein
MLRIPDPVLFVLFFYPWIRDKHLVFRELKPNFLGLKILIKYLCIFVDAVPDPGSFLLLIRDLGMEKFGSGIRYTHLGSAIRTGFYHKNERLTLLSVVWYRYLPVTDE